LVGGMLEGLSSQLVVRLFTQSGWTAVQKQQQHAAVTAANNSKKQGRASSVLVLWWCECYWSSGGMAR